MWVVPVGSTVSLRKPLLAGQVVAPRGFPNGSRRRWVWASVVALMASSPVPWSSPKVQVRLVAVRTALGYEFCGWVVTAKPEWTAFIAGVKDGEFDTA